MIVVVSTVIFDRSVALKITTFTRYALQIELNSSAGRCVDLKRAVIHFQLLIESRSINCSYGRTIEIAVTPLLYTWFIIIITLFLFANHWRNGYLAVHCSGGEFTFTTNFGYIYLSSTDSNVHRWTPVEHRLPELGEITENESYHICDLVN